MSCYYQMFPKVLYSVKKNKPNHNAEKSLSLPLSASAFVLSVSAFLFPVSLYSILCYLLS